MPFDPAVVAGYVAALEGRRWFGLLGLPFSDDERAALAELTPRCVRIETWSQARAVADDVRANAAYDRDAREALALRERAQATAGPEPVLHALSAIVDRGLTVFFAAAERALARAGLRDEEFTRVAAGAAAEAAYRGALAAAVEGPAHRFVRIEALFAAGRWPVAHIGDALHVF